MKYPSLFTAQLPLMTVALVAASVGDIYTFWGCVAMSFVFLWAWIWLAHIELNVAQWYFYLVKFSRREMTVESYDMMVDHVFK